MARSTAPFTWSAGSSSPVHTVFLFAAPESAAKAYLTLISAVARLSRSTDLVEQLEQAQDADALFAVLQQVPLRQTDTNRTSLAASGRSRL
jgi:mannitol/fructose-specific phosphotransferase system IIA component (Ntr-type)